VGLWKPCTDTPQLPLLLLLMLLPLAHPGSNCCQPALAGMPAAAGYVKELSDMLEVLRPVGLPLLKLLKLLKLPLLLPPPAA
jgi:hypothetical protein